MEKYLIYIIVGLLVILTVLWFLNLLMLKTKNNTNVWLSRGVYICGILCVLLNAVRILDANQVNRGTLFVANTIALISIVIAFLRSEKKNNDSEYEV